MELNAKNLEKLVNEQEGEDIKYINTKDSLNVNQLLNALENESNASIMKLTTTEIQKQKNDILQHLQLERKLLKSFNKKLKQYRYCTDLSDLQYGYYIRWIPLKNPDNIYLTNGATITDIKYINDSLQILCKNFRNRFFQIKFDEVIIFQKLSNQEKVILNVLNYLEK
tara:strand:- start:34 stop:537 length:504 start_codon:yes stop_codon:yes gene_type:complete